MKREFAVFAMLLCGLGLFGPLHGPAAQAESRAYLTQYYQRYDKNSDGRLEPQEWKSSRLAKSIEDAIQDAGFNPEDSVSITRLIDARVKKSDRSRNDKDKKSTTSTYRSKIGHERLDKKVADWFRERDKDRNGQVAMAEFASDWTDSLMSDFLKLDANQDGVITPEESLEGEPGGSSLASSRTDRGYGSSSRTSPRSTATSASSSSDDKSSPAKSQSSEGGSESVEGVSAAYVSYSKGIIAKYDQNGDGALTKSEWGEMSQSPAEADTDGDHRITFVEYARWISKGS